MSNVKKLSPTDLITRKLSHKLNVSEDIIDKVIGFQWKTAREALSTSKTVEISNFGVFKIRPKKITHNIELSEAQIQKYHKYLETEEDPDKIRKINYAINHLENKITYLKTKLDETKD